MKKRKIKRRPPGTIHIADMVQAIECAVWVRINDSIVHHVTNGHGQPEIIVAVKKRTIRVSLACFCVEDDSPWVAGGTEVDDIAVAIVSTVNERLNR